MWADQQRIVVGDTEQYVSPNGTVYPANYPKSEIAGLFPVLETTPPVDQNVVIVGWHVGPDYSMIWDVRPKTSEEIAAATAQEKNTLLAQLASIDSRKTRPLSDIALGLGDEAGPDGMTPRQRLAALEEEAAEVRVLL